MSKSRKITVLVPYSANNNLYVANVRKAISDAGFDVVSIRALLKNPFILFKCKLFNFNWFETCNSKVDYIKKNLILRVLHILGKKIVYTLHNVQPHDNNNPYSIRLMKLLYCYSDAVIGLCPDTANVIETISHTCNPNEKLHIVPHPNYINNFTVPDDICFKVKAYRDALDISESKKVFMFFGSILPYKNIELVVDAFKEISDENMVLLIAGRPKNSEYENKLRERIGNKGNIKCDFRFIPDNEVQVLFCVADILVFPYQKISSLNSGAVYLSFSLKKTVICPDIGTINALEDKSFVYSYIFNKKTEYEELKQCIEHVKNDLSVDGTVLTEKGLQAYEYVKEHHSMALVSASYKKIYSDLLD